MRIWCVVVLTLIMCGVGATVVSASTLGIYWTNNRGGGLGKIQHANLDGSNVEDVVTGLSVPMGLALDVPSNEMYWVHRGLQKIQRAINQSI